MSSSTSTSEPGPEGLPPRLFAATEARRFLRLCLATAAVLVAAAVGVNAWALLVARDLDGVGLVGFQRAKIAALDGPDLLLVGDSSLGNGIDRRVLDETLGISSANLALNGLFGYAGGRNLLASVPPASLPPRVVVMQTADMLTRPPADLAAVVSAPGFGLDPSEPRFRERFGAAIRFLWNIPPSTVIGSLLGRTARGIDPEIDYIRQARRDRMRPPSRISIPAADIRPEKVLEMRALARWCADRGIEAWYFHGPLVASTVEASGEYFDEANRLLSDAGFRVVAPRPLALHPEAIGDGEDHVRPELRAASTRWHAERLRAAWRGETPSAGAASGSLGDPAAPYRRDGSD